MVSHSVDPVDQALGAVLVERRLLAEEQLAWAWGALGRSPGARLGPLVVHQGWVDPAVLRHVLAEHPGPAMRCGACGARCPRPLPGSAASCALCGRPLDATLADLPAGSGWPDGASRGPLVAPAVDSARQRRPGSSTRDPHEPPDLLGTLPLGQEMCATTGRYVLREKLGEGGYGAVYRAWDPQTERAVALKVLVRSGQRARKRFEREVRAAARLRHPHAVALIDSGLAWGRPFLVMELVAGRSLKERVENGRVTPAEAAAWLRDAARAVQHAHEMGVFHRDLKPSNLLIEDDSGRALVADFGLAKLDDQRSRLTKTGALLGTPNYMAPEQARDGAVDARSEVYSLGAVLYFALTGVPPLEITSELQLLTDLPSRVPERPSARRRGLARALDAICLRALEKDPARRYATAEELARDLDRWLSGRPVEAAGGGGWRGRAGLVAGAVLVVGVAAGVVAALQQTGPRVDPAALAAAAALLDRAAAGPVTAEGVEDDLDALAAPGVEELLGERVRPVLEGLEAAWLGVALDAGDAEERTELERALAARAATPLGEPLPPSGAAALAAGEARLLATNPGPRLRSRVAAAQEEALGAGPLLAARLAAAALARGPDDGRAAARYLRHEADGARAADMVGWLVRARAPRALELALAARREHGEGSAFAALVERTLRRSGLAPAADGPPARRARAWLAVGEAARAVEAAGAALEADPEDLEALLVRARAHADLRDRVAARLDLERACALAPSDPRPWIERGRLRRESAPAAALADLDRALGLAPTSTWALVERARVRIELGQPKRAFADAEEAVRLDPLHPACWEARGRVHLELDAFGRAEVDLRRALALDPERASSWRLVGRVAYERRDLEQALSATDRAVELNPREASFWLSRGVVKDVRGDHRGALHDYDRALELDPELARGYSNRSTARYALGDVAGAKEDLERALSLEPDEPTFVLNHGVYLMEEGQVEAALRAFERAVELDPTSATAHLNLGVARGKLGGGAAGVRDLERAVELEPQDPSYRSTLGAVRAQSGDLEGALEEFRRAVKIDPETPHYQHQLGRALRDTGRYREALEALDRAVALLPQEPRFWLDRARTHQALHDVTSAVADLDRALEADPRHRPAWRLRGALRLDLGQIVDALEDLNRAVDLEPNDPETLSLRAEARLRLRDLAGAVADIERAYAYDRRLSSTLLRRARLHLKDGAVAPAVFYLEQIVARDPDGPEAAAARDLLPQLQRLGR